VHAANTDRGQGIANLRTHTARGSIVNAGFQVGLAGLSLVQRLGIAAFLTREEFGLWGILLACLFTLIWVKQVGIRDKYIQQSDPDQEAAYQKAFTLELGMSATYSAVCMVALPIYAVAYGHTEIILPGMVLSTTLIINAFETPAWIPYRRMEYGRQRVLSSVDPVVSVIATLGLAAAGFGIWGLVAGSLFGSVVGATVCVASCPYRMRLRFDRQTVREYVSFSMPLLGNGFSRMFVIQGTLLVANAAVGLAGIGAIGLAGSFLNFADGVDAIVSTTIYPAVCAVAGSSERLAEVFEKSNRVALMWAMPFTVALALFASDLNHFLFHDRWSSAVGLIIVVALSTGFGQVAFNWGLFMRATNRTKPLFRASLIQVAVFGVVSVPAILEFGLTGYAISAVAGMLGQVAVRGHYMRTIFPAFSVVRQAARAAAPVAPGAAAVLALRQLPGADDTLLQTAAELVLFAGLSAVFTFVLERPLITELAGYLRGRVTRPASAATLVAGAS
jgi:O-antigen/teichoic acid export membrane protein